ncbi:MAG: response regulator transcription factor [Saprospiraceae bacterium]|jgi:DNA-binding NarL/FixJ family response regulator|nr:response regulator transcription factor [Saprospiraceae bacterium]
MIRVAIFDDHPAIIDALTSHFDQIGDIKIVGKFTETGTLFEFLEENEVDFLVSDVLTDEEIGLAVFETIALKYNNIRIIAFTSIKSAFIHEELRNLGVIAIVNKKEKIHLISDFILQYKEEIKRLKPYKSMTLTPKEKEIAHYLAQGLSAKEISSITQNSINTINNQKNTLLEKFECSNTTVLILKLTQMGLIDVI